MGASKMQIDTCSIETLLVSMNDIKNHTYAQNRSDWVFPYATMRNNLIQADGVASLQLIELYAYSHLSCLSC